MPRFLPALLFLIGTAHSFAGVTNVANDASGIVLFRQRGYERLDKPLEFKHIEQNQAYFDVVSKDNLLLHIETDLVVKVVYFLNPTTFPTKFEPEDLAVIKAKIDELHTLAPLSPDAARLAASQLQYLQNLYDTESARYKQTSTIAAQKFASDQEKAAFDKKCDLMRLELQASLTDIQHSEDLVRQMEPLAPSSEMLTGVLAKWNEEKNRALQLDGECRQLWDTALETYPTSFKPVADLNAIPDFPGDMKDKIADLQAQMDQFRGAVTLRQTLLYCKNAIPALFLLNQMPDLVAKIKGLQYKEAGDISQKAMLQVRPDQFVDPYTTVYDTFKNYTGLVDDIRNRYFRQLTKAKAAEGNFTNREVLTEYQKAYDIIPDTAVAQKIELLKLQIKQQ